MSCRVTGLHNLSGLDQFDKFVSLAHFLVSKKRTTAHLRTPFHYFQLTSQALTMPLLLPDSEKFPMAVWSPYYSFVATPRLRIGYTSTTPWLRSPASIAARHAITLIVRLGT